MESFPLESWQVEYNSGIPVYRQIINQVSAALASGALKNGDQLPTIRALSAHLNVNPNTVARAYRELELKEIIVSERGSGCFIQARGFATEAAGKKAKLEILYHKLLAEAANSGLTKLELLRFIQERNSIKP